MRGQINLLKSEWLKLKTSTALRNTWLLVLIVVPIFSYLEGRQYLSLGLDASPATNPQLLAPIAPLDYLGLSATGLSTMVLTIFAGFIGGMEFQGHQLRTSLLTCNHRLQFFCGKVMTVSLTLLSLSFLSTYFSYIAMHLALGKEGLNPIFLNTAAWEHIFFRVLALSMIGILAFLLGFLARTMLLPLIFLVPQIYNLGDYLAQHTAFGNYLPVAATNFLLAEPYSFYRENHLKGLTILLIWLLTAALFAYVRFSRNDLGGHY
ncbi:ABC transporter permease [Streptococcus massiliensis]|uniref:Membrane protein n=1 Tax=Streptococcus massiliensis TaxID=313439 RepID=A0A380L158_9STRE|nr:ABC transporter permease [Streptococcus massiliensis]SUN76420.1 membrane protein [Streptococcus massiliensis]